MTIAPSPEPPAFVQLTAQDFVRIDQLLPADSPRLDGEAGLHPAATGGNPALDAVVCEVTGAAGLVVDVGQNMSQRFPPFDSGLVAGGSDGC